MAHKPYTHVWCVVKGDTHWHFTTRKDAEAKAHAVALDRISESGQIDIFQLVGDNWVWRSSGLTTVCGPEGTF